MKIDLLRIFNSFLKILMALFISIILYLNVLIYNKWLLKNYWMILILKENKNKKESKLLKWKIEINQISMKVILKIYWK
jgi:hypothetical protein